MPTTTATTGPPHRTADDGLTVRQRVSRPALAEAVRDRIRELHDRGVCTFTAADFAEAARNTGRSLAWVGDHLLVLESLGILRPASGTGERAWRASNASEYLR